MICPLGGFKKGYFQIKPVKKLSKLSFIAQNKPEPAVAGCHSNHFEYNRQNLFSLLEFNGTQLIFVT